MDHLESAKTCNYCGSSRLDIFHIGSDCHYVHCNGCQADGPQRCSEECAVRAWNRVMPRTQVNDAEEEENNESANQ